MNVETELLEKQKEIDKLKAKLEIVSANLNDSVELDYKQKEKLEKLKFNDPETWRIKINKIEREARERRNMAIDEATKEVERKIELQKRKTILEKFNEDNPDIKITDDIIKYDVPPRITRKLENGEVEFVEFLDEVKEFIKAPKAVFSDYQLVNQPNIGKVGGRDTSVDGDENASLDEIYKKAIL